MKQTSIRVSDSTSGNDKASINMTPDIVRITFTFPPHGTQSGFTFDRGVLKGAPWSTGFAPVNGVVIDSQCRTIKVDGASEVKELKLDRRLLSMSDWTTTLGNDRLLEEAGYTADNRLFPQLKTLTIMGDIFEAHREGDSMLRASINRLISGCFDQGSIENLELCFPEDPVFLEWLDDRDLDALKVAGKQYEIDNLLVDSINRKCLPEHCLSRITYRNVTRQSIPSQAGIRYLIHLHPITQRFTWLGSEPSPTQPIRTSVTCPHIALGVFEPLSPAS